MTPFVAEKEIPMQQYYNGNQKMMLLQTYCEKKLVHLRTYLNGLAATELPHIAKLTEKYNIRGIATCGLRPQPTGAESKDFKAYQNCEDFPTTWSRTPTYAFACTSHVDDSDKPSLEKKKEWYRKATNKNWKAASAFIDSPYFGLPTTCGYQFVYKDELAKNQLDPCQHFVQEGFNIAMELRDGDAHTFLGNSHAHHTSLATCSRRSDGKINMFNRDDNFLIYAWGSTDNGSTVDGVDNANGGGAGAPNVWIPLHVIADNHGNNHYPPWGPDNIQDADDGVEIQFGIL